MSGSLIPISDEQAKVGQEILKTLRGLGSFIKTALGSTPEDLIAYLGGDWLRVRRAENLIRVFEKAGRLLADRHVAEPIPASLSVALPLLQAAADEDRDELVDLWARLLANSLDPNLGNVRHSFIDAVKQMDPPDALVLKFLFEGNFRRVLPPKASQSVTMNQNETTDVAIGRTEDSIEVSLRHLEAIGFCHDSGNYMGLNLYFNVKFREFMRACYPEIDR